MTRKDIMRRLRSLLTKACLLAPCICYGQPMAYFSFRSYQDGELIMSLVTSSTQGELLLGKGDTIIPLQGAILDDVFTARVRIPCEQLSEPTTLYWSVKGEALQAAKVPAQRCAVAVPTLPPVRFIVQDGQCIVDTGGNTLWRTATELAKRNGATVYQNIYALFITNRSAFYGEDISRLYRQQLRCPDGEIFKRLTPEHARRLFAEAEAFNG